MRLFVAFFMFAASISSSHATNLNISGSLFHIAEHPYDETADPEAPAPLYVDAWIEWDNAWRNSKNHDAVWIFVKVEGIDNSGARVVRHARIIDDIEFLSSGGNTRMTSERSADNVGAFIRTASRFRGDVRTKLRIPINADIRDGLSHETLRAKVFGIEMVYIPEGPFYVGAGSPEAINYGAFYRSAGNNDYGGHYRIENEGAIAVGSEEGALTYNNEAQRYFLGDAEGPVPAAFPKGYNAFYMMKYEVSQGQYANFLNHLEYYAPHLRLNFGGPDYYQKRGTLKLDNNRVVAERPQRPANYISWEDGIAFLDWAGLRPMTDFEFTKASRGPDRPIPGDYVWGGDNMNVLARAVLEEGDTGMLNDMSEAELTDGNREIFGASYYWVMDLSGSLWERVVTIGDKAGRAFTGAHGDGRLVSWGETNEENWPRELGSPRREKGFGYRGGGFYDEGGPYDLYRPHSRVAYRPYGNWSGGPRHRAYGIRGVRTHDVQN